MRKATQISLYITTCALSAATIILCALFLSGWGVLFKVAFYGLSALAIIAGTLFLVFKKEGLFKTCFILTCVLAFFCAVVVALSEIGNLGELSSDQARIEKLTQMIRDSGSWGMLVYFFVQVLQILILPLPAVVCYIPGTLIWGPGIATLLASAGVLVGSFIAYWLGRLVGKRVVVWIAGREVTEKYSGYIAKKGKMPFVIMQILPFFPDDVLCLIAGMTCMNFPFFAAVMIIVRPCIVAAYCYLGGLIPFSGWGIPVWIAIFAVCAVLAVLSFKYQDRFEGWLFSLFNRKKKKGEPQPEEITSAPANDENLYPSSENPAETPSEFNEITKSPPE